MRIDQTNVFRLQRPRKRAPGSQPDIVIVCECGATDTIRAKGNTPSECIAKRFRHRDWQVDNHGKKALCKECQMKGKANGPGQTTEALRSQVAAVRLLDEHFDIDAGRYSGDWSDLAVATEVALAETAIASLRETAYGPLAVDPEVSRITADLDALSARWQAEHADLAEMFKNCEQDIGKEIAALQCRLAEATKGRKAPNGAA